MQARIWNEFAHKFRWNDLAAKSLSRIEQEDRLGYRTDIVATFDLIDSREGQGNEKPNEGERSGIAWNRRSPCCLSHQ